MGRKTQARRTTDERERAAAMRRLRLERGWTIATVARRADRTPSQISRAENGLGRPLAWLAMPGIFGVTEEQARQPCPGCGSYPPLGYTCQRCGAKGPPAGRTTHQGWRDDPETPRFGADPAEVQP